jgi:hypothetical protein
MVGQRFILAISVVLLGSTAASANQLTASWVDTSGGIATTRVERRLGSDIAYTAIADVPPGGTSYVDATVSSGTTYCYRVYAYNAAGASPYSPEVCAASASTTTTTVTVSKTGSGTGTVASTPAGIDCGTVCSATFASGSSVALAATPGAGSTFAGWTSGGCSGTAPCTFVGNTAITITASFSATSVTPKSDTTPPVAALSLPSTLKRKSSVTLSATASDNVRVVKVEFYVNGSLQCSNLATPYTCGWRIPAAVNKSYTLQAKAYDAAGNVGLSPRITVVPQ